MPGLCGIASQRALGDAGAIIQRLRKVHELPQVGFHETFDVTECLVAAQFTADSMFRDNNFIQRHESGDLGILVEGEIFNLDELKEASTDSRAGGEVLLQSYLKHGENFVYRLSGEFTIIIYDRRKHVLKVFADHVASYPMYYMESNGNLLFGSEKKFISAIQDKPGEVDPVGLLQLFVHIHNLDDRTYISGLKRMVPGEQLTWVAGRTQRTRRELLAESRDNAAGREDLIEEWAHQLKLATALRMEGGRRVLMSLSAGLDSRAVSCAIDRKRRPIWARTWGNEQSGEVQYARQIASKLGFDHFVEDPTRFLHSDGIRAIVWRTEGEIQYRNGISIFSHGKICERADFVAGGWLGDASSGAHLRPFMFVPMKRGQFINQIFQWYCVFNKELLSAVLNPQFLDRYWGDVEELFHRSYDRYASLTNVQAHETWDLFNRQTRMTISSMPVDSHLFGKVRVFFDRNYLRFVMGLPLSARVGQNMYKSLIYRLGPEIREVPDANTDKLLRPTGRANLFAYLNANQHKALRRFRLTAGLAGKVDSRIVPPENLADTIRRDVRLRELVMRFVASEYCDPAIFNRAGIRQLLDEHYFGSADRSKLISIIATFAVALPYFIYDRQVRCPHDADPRMPSMEDSENA